MNSKYREFLISNIVVTFFTILICLLLDNILILYIKDFLIRVFFLSFLGSFFYYFLIKFTLDEFFRGNSNLEKTFKETIHELNTPIATINMNLQMLKKSKLDSKSLSRLQRVELASNSILSLYEDMEYVLKSQIGSVDNSIFELKETIDSILEKFIDIQGNIKIRNRVTYLEIECDKKGFIKSISNIISNAIKYNRLNGKIDIYLENSILIIEDSGIGISDIHTIFEEYYQENSSNKGFGMGLFMVKRFCDNYRVDIKIDSEVGVGTKIALDLVSIKKV